MTNLRANITISRQPSNGRAVMRKAHEDGI